MAFQLNKAIGGHTSNYWKIRNFTNLDEDGSTCTFVVCLYKDAATRTADINDIIKPYQITLNGDDFPLGLTAQNVVDKNTRKLLYEKLKTMDAVSLNNDTENTADFTAASDV